MARRPNSRQIAVLIGFVLLSLIGSRYLGGSPSTDIPSQLASPRFVSPVPSQPPPTRSRMESPTFGSPSSATPAHALPFDFPVTYGLVSRVVDGDTVVLSTGDRLRYIGIDTPETWTEPVECYAGEAKERNRKLVEGRRVALRKDVSERDRYDRLLRYVYLEDGMFVNEVLVREGYASAVTFPPDLLFNEYFRQLEREARRAGRGLWGETCGQ